MGATTLVRGRWVVASAYAPVLEDAAVVVEGDRVAAMVDWRQARERHPHAEVIGSDRSAVLPGFINAHHHGQAVTSLQLGVAEDRLEPWLLSWAGVRERDRYLDTLLGSARLLGTGVTATLDLWSGGGSAEAYARSVQDAVRGYRDAGIRACFAPGLRTQSHLVWGAGEDERFIAGLPPALRDDARSLMPSGNLGEDEYLAVMADAAAALAGDGRVDLWYSIPGPQWASDAFMQRIVERARAAGAGVQTHVNESVYEKLHAHRAWGCDTMLHLERLGILGPRFSIAHGVWLSQAEIEVLARTGTAISHNPGSNLRLFAGIAPLQALRAAGVTVALGMDATTLGDDEDMFAEMRLALRLARRPELGAPAPSPADVFALATLGGARLLGRENELGALAPGRAADMVVVDLERVTWPWAAPECDPLTLIVLRARRRDVTAVLVGGEVVHRAGSPTRFDVEAAGRELARAMAQAPHPAAGEAAWRRIRPHVEAWYRAWDVPDPVPFVAWNSRS
jgi:cytosine/adenosine deaminase-related metal-dependent hydrolase